MIPEIILASASPRRADILKKYGITTVNQPTLMIYLYQRVLYKRGLFLLKEDFL